MTGTSGIPSLPAGASKGLLNGGILESADWLARGLHAPNSPPAMHRLKSITGLTCGLFVGRKLMDIIVGETPSGKKIDKERLPAVLKPLHGLMHYNHYSDDPHDRWLKVLDNTIPAILGSVGFMAGSYNFFGAGISGKAPRLDTVNKAFGAAQTAGALSLGEVIPKVELEAATHLRPAGALTFIPGSASGIAMTPANPGISVGEMFMAGSGRKTLSVRGVVNDVLKFVGVDLNAYYKKVNGGGNSVTGFGAIGTIDHMVNHLAENRAVHPEKMHAMAESVLVDLFGKHGKEKVGAFVEKLQQLRLQDPKDISKGLKGVDEIRKGLETHLKKTGFHDTLHEIGLDPRNAKLLNRGVFGGVARWLGAGEPIDKIRAEFIKQETARRPDIPFNPVPFEDPSSILGTHGLAKLAGAGAVGVLGYQGYKHLTKDKHKAEPEPEATPSPALQSNGHGKENGASFASHIQLRGQNASFSDSVSPSSHNHEKQHKPKGLMNGAVLDTLEWTTSVFNVPPGKHRWLNAAGLTLGFHVGARTMEAMTGRSLLTGKELAAKEMSSWVRPLFEKMKDGNMLLKYNPHSDLPKDRWMFVMHAVAPAIIGAAGALAGSAIFFRERNKKIKKAEYLDDYVDKAAMVQSGPWTQLSAVSSIFGSAAGFQLLPFPNYGVNLGTRFTLGSGRKVAAPGLGHVWSGNDSIYPYAPPAMLNHMIKYAVNNPAETPEQLDAMASAVLKPLYKNVTKEQLQSFVNEVHAVRDKFLCHGGVPEDLKADCEKELAAHFKGAGFENTLSKIGLDPLKAELGNNGWSGKIAESLGAKHKMQKLHTEFAERYKHRHQDQAFSLSS